jgi:hypothetical protein
MLKPNFVISKKEQAMTFLVLFCPVTQNASKSLTAN